MALCSFSERFAVYDVTPVENLFLLEYMPYAPGDYVRVYLYGLMQCHHPDADATLPGMARVLHLPQEQVLSALRYWEQKGLVVGMSDSPPTFEYVNVRSAMMQEKRPDADGVYQYREFNNQLQGILGLLHPQQFKKAMEWVEDLKLAPEVVLLMVREKTAQLTEGQKKRSLAYLFKVFDETALDFANRNIRSVELAEKELSRGRPGFKMAASVLDYFNLRRSPTTAEVELATKWISDWKLDDKAVLGALRQTAGSSNPSFAYLDRILQRHSDCAQGEGGIERSMEADRQLFDTTKLILSELGQASRAPSESQRQAVQRFLDQGFEKDVLVRAAVRCNRSGRRSFDQLELELARFYALGITTAQAAETYNQEREDLRIKAAQVFDRAGIERRPTETDLDQLRDWLKAAPFELVLYAADCAHGLKLPTRAMAKNLFDWALKGIVDVEGAKMARAAGRASAPSATDKPKAPSAAQSYSQRAYDQGFFEDFFANLDDDTKPNH